MGNKIQFLPLLCFILFPVTFIITYSMAVSSDHIYPVYSYISDTGSLSTESCWFALFLSLTAFVLGLVIYIRHMQVEEFYRLKKSIWMPRINMISIILGMITCLGVMCVGAFQQTNSMPMHALGAVLAFLGGSTYLTIQAYFTFTMLPMFTNRPIAILRMFIGITCTILFFTTFSTAIVSMAGFEGENALKWERSEPNWNLHVLSVTTEWIMVALFDVYILTIMIDFRRIHFKAPQVESFLQRV